MKYYAVKSGNQTGIFTNWDDCKASVDGFSGAVYKSFPSEKEALDYLNDTASHTVKPATTEPVIDETKLIAPENTAVAFCDGSYNDTTKQFSYGLVIFCSDKVYEFSKAFDCIDESRNVAGEICGAMTAMQFCVNHHIPKLDLYYDYAGIAFWATKVWKANKDITKQYVQFCDSISDKLTVNFVKVKSHSGVKFNERVDKLAKAAIGL